MHELARLYNASTDSADYAARYIDRVQTLLAALDPTVIAQVVDVLHHACSKGRMLYFMANGGSGAIASHWVNDLVAGAYVEGVPAFRAYALGDNVPSLTAIANDCGYDEVFAQQLHGRMQPGDVVIALSVSGNSPNILRGLEVARAQGAVCIGLCGLDGGALPDHCDIVLHVPTTADEYGPVEDAFSVVAHMVTGWLTMRRGRWLHHAPPTNGKQGAHVEP